MSKTKQNKIILCILDGFATGDKNNPYNAFEASNAVNLKQAITEYPNTLIHASGTQVGLPEGQMGNSEIGHSTIGAGRVLKQNLIKITDELPDKTFNELSQKTVHLVGLLSDGGIHSHINHLKILISQIPNTANLFLHVITDGRDAGIKDTLRLKFLDEFKNIQIATISGRYYAMDRDNRLDRTSLYYDSIFGKTNNQFDNPVKYIEDSYQKNITDEFIEPATHKDFTGIQKDHVVIFFNYRSDRMRQIVSMTSKEIDKKQIYTLTNYFNTSKEFCDINVIFEDTKIQNTLPDVYQNNNLKQLRIAETEKYPHVTFFFNSQKEELYKNEERIMIQSPKVKSYDMQPEMSLPELEKELIQNIKTEKFDLIVCNIANCDMVGHTGDFKATIKAINRVDEFIGKIIKQSQENNYILCITSDHGNIDEMHNIETNQKNTCHSNAKVPFIICDKKTKIKQSNTFSLANIAPTILKLAGLEIPKEMSEAMI